MASETNQSAEKRPPQQLDPALASCRKKKSEHASFLADVRDHIDEFIHASMDEHKTCFQKTIKKMFGMSKIVAERTSGSGTKEAEVESVLPLQTTVSQLGRKGK